MFICAVHGVEGEESTVIQDKQYGRERCTTQTAKSTIHHWLLQRKYAMTQVVYGINDGLSNGPAAADALLFRVFLTTKSDTSQLPPGSAETSIPSCTIPSLTVSSLIAADTSPSKNCFLCGGIRVASGGQYQAENFSHLRGCE